ncbi:RNA polymerase sigma factor [Thermoproteota archaeon]
MNEYFDKDSNQYSMEDIFKEHKKKMYRLAMHIVGNPSDAEDILQSAFVKILDNIKGFRQESKLSTWIYRITYNEALLYIRKRYKETGITDINILQEDKTLPSVFVNWPDIPDQELLDKELKERIQDVLGRMPIGYRMPLLLHNAEHLSLKDTAQILGLNLNTLKTHLHRATLLIKQELADYAKDKLLKEKHRAEHCSLLTGFVYDYVQGNIEKAEAESFHNHIKDCDNCNSFLDTYTQAIRITKALECQDLSDELIEKIKSFNS